MVYDILSKCSTVKHSGIVRTKYLVATICCVSVSFLYLHVLLILHLKDTILHLAARNPRPEVTIVILEAYKRSDLVQKVLCTRNKQGDSPLNVAVKYGNVQIVMLLYSECQKACPHVITEAEDGELNLT